MTPEEIKGRALARFAQLAPKKYGRGQQEHRGILTERKGLLNDMEEEVIDLWFYLQAFKIKLEEEERKRLDLG